MIEVLRLGHRIYRDHRLSSHVALTARAFFANKLYYSGQKDGKLENSIKKVVKDFGGKFEIEYVKEPIKLIKDKKKEGYKIINLTMYGINLPDSIQKIKKFKKMLIIVGGEKVPIEFYKTSDFNVAIGNTPHSEVAALAIFLDYYFQGKELSKNFKGKKKIIPQERGKKVIR